MVEERSYLVVAARNEFINLINEYNTTVILFIGKEGIVIILIRLSDCFI